MHYSHSRSHSAIVRFTAVFLPKLIAAVVMFVLLVTPLQPVFAQANSSAAGSGNGAETSEGATTGGGSGQDTGGHNGSGTGSVGGSGVSSVSIGKASGAIKNSETTKRVDTATRSNIGRPTEKAKNIVQDTKPRLEPQGNPPTLPPDLYRDNSRDVVKSQHIEPDLLTGSLHYEFPIIVPPGRNNMSPDLSLSYTSQPSSNIGIYGYGWSDNIPYIERINRKGSEQLYIANFFSSSFDGELLTTDGSTSTLSYRPKVENGDFRTYSYVNGNTWLVTDKFGVQYKFGYATTTQQYDPNNSSKIFKWMLQEVRDSNNNYVTYEYFKDGNQIYPSKITYTGNGSTNGIFEVDFLRESRTDVMTSMNSGFSVTSNFRINQILVKINGTWVRKYDLGYIHSANYVRSLLDSITETDQDESSNTTTQPATLFRYQGDGGRKGWADSETFPEPFVNVPSDNGVRMVDVTGDGQPDLMAARTSTSTTTYVKTPSGWVETDSLGSPQAFVAIPANAERGVELADVNGDGLVDVLYYPYYLGTANSTYINNGNGWTEDPTWQIPTSMNFLFDPGIKNQENGVRFVDVNGDGLVDILKARVESANSTSSLAFINNGAGWTQSDLWRSPVSFVYYDNRDLGTRFADVNGDGLPDIISAQQTGLETNNNQIWINNGNGWTRDTSWVVPGPMGFVDVTSKADMGVRIADVNGDGLPDLLLANNARLIQTMAFLNNGTGWTRDDDWMISTGLGGFTNVYSEDQGLRIIDANGDGMDDLVRGNGSERNIFRNTAPRIDLLTDIGVSSGATTTIIYKTTAMYDNGTSYLNPHLPQNYDTVQSIGVRDGMGHVATTTYSYEGGKYYYNGAYDRQPAGFHSITKTDPAGTTVKTFYHQGDTSDTSLGEYDDSRAKIGKPFRVEVADAAGNLYSKTIQKWDSSDLGSGSTFVKNVRKTEESYDGLSTHKDRAEEYSYATSTGNLIQKKEWGQVTGTDDGSFTDTGADDFMTAISYASTTSSVVKGLPFEEIRTDHSGTVSGAIRHYYDNLSLGSVSLGNETKTEKLKSGSAFINTQNTYNSYGLVTQTLDPRGKQTTYSYDTYNLYPATTTNALNQKTRYTYDYSLGKPKQVIDPNGYVFKTVYDAVDRVLEEKQPDVTATTTLVTKTLYSYSNSGLPRLIQKVDYLNAATSTISYSYLDGLGRVIQTRGETKTPNTFAVKDTQYTNVGTIDKESLPYFGTGSSVAVATTTPTLYTSYTYDPLLRVKTVANALGTTTNTYANWKLTVTDPNGKNKDLTKDAYDNLVQVDEHNATSTYTTTYAWNGNKNLTKITDANGNIRNFTYNALGHLLTSEDLHAVGDGTFGTWTYQYDNAGNLATSTDPKSQIIGYAYDDLNRPTTENYVGSPGTEVFYTYDSCVGGVGKLCTITSPVVTISNEYNPLGAVKKETKGVDNVAYITLYDFDRQGNMTKITHPDGSDTANVYNGAGQLWKVAWEDPDTSTVIPILTDLSYSPLGQVSFMNYGNGATTTNTYDPAKLYRLSNKVTRHNTDKYQDLTYTYDSVGNVTKVVDASKTNTAKTTDYLYDDLYRLTQASTTNATSTNYIQTYSYSAIGNITNKSDVGPYTYAGGVGSNYANPHAVTAISGSPLMYDNDGNLLTYGSQTNTWDYKNHLIASGNGHATSTATYDPSGERITYTDSVGTTTYANKFYDELGDTKSKHIYAGDDLVATVETAPTQIVIVGEGMTIGSDETSNLGIGDGGGTTPPVSHTVHFVHDDHLSGSNTVTSATSTLEETTDYYPYGKIKLDLTTTAFAEKHKFTGHTYDANTDLTYAKARYYNGNNGRFLSQDPAFLNVQKLDLTNPQNLNSYSYALNNPLKYVDPNGESAQTFGEGLLTGLATGLFITAAIATAPVTISASLAAGLAIAGTAAVGYGTYSNYQAFQGGEISKDQFDYNAGNLLGGLILPTKLSKLSGEIGGIESNQTLNLPAPGERYTNVFPTNPNELMPDAIRDARGFIYPNSNTRIRYEAHGTDPGGVYNPRHADPHYHVDVRIDPSKSFNNKNNTTTLLPPGYVLGAGKGFLPGESFPGITVRSSGGR